MGSHVTFASNGSDAPGYLAVPESGSGPGLIVIQEWWGLVPHIESVCDRFAADGFVALAPDLFHGVTTTEPDEAGKLLMGLNLDRAAKDLSGAIDFLRDQSFVTSAKVGVTGFCMGGGLTLVLACHRPGDLYAAVPWYGVIPWPEAQPDWSKLEAPVQGHYAELDGFFTPDAARALEAQLLDLGKQVEFFVYDGTDHAFFNDTRPEVYDADAAATAYDRTIAFLCANAS